MLSHERHIDLPRNVLHPVIGFRGFLQGLSGQERYLLPPAVVLILNKQIRLQINSFIAAPLGVAPDIQHLGKFLIPALEAKR